LVIINIMVTIIFHSSILLSIAIKLCRIIRRSKSKIQIECKLKLKLKLKHDLTLKIVNYNVLPIYLKTNNIIQ